MNETIRGDNGEIRRVRAKARQEALEGYKTEEQAKRNHERKLRRQDEPR
ncbi:MAG TPA: hypothetical protein VF934_05595 [Burkholderiales bacterium]